MKKIAACALVLMSVIVFSAPEISAQQARTEQFVGGMGKKFIRGISNVFTGWMEIPTQVYKGYKDCQFLGACTGIFKGVWYSAGRTFSGFGDMAGFWAADPKDNAGVGIPLDGQNAWDEGTRYNFTDPSFGQATIAPMGKKLARGLGNALFGFLEVPGQLVKGMKDGACDIGAGEALWYWFSREMDGVYDVATFPLPTPKETVGLAFDEEWPWTAMKMDK